MLKGGENCKTITNLNRVLQWLHDRQADRSALLVAIGGGAMTDLVGFTASIFMRGIGFLSVPTTLVGQVDAAIGGKTAINLSGTKNVVGAFHFPHCVICDTQFLSTLKPSQIKDGLIESYKIFAACGRRSWCRHNQRVDDYLRSSGEGLIPLIWDALRLKVKVVNLDPFENDFRRVLNFGHTAGHAYEALSGQSHGRSIAFGIVVATELSKRQAGLIASEGEEIRKTVTTIYRHFRTGLCNAKLLWDKILHDKKRRADEVNFVLLNSYGKTVIKALNYRQFETGVTAALEHIRG